MTTRLNAVPRFILARRRAMCFSGARLLLAALAAFSLSGCDKLAPAKDAVLSLTDKVLSRKGVRLTARPKVGDVQAYHVLIESSTPQWLKEGVKESIASLSMRIRSRAIEKESDGWVRIEAEILEGRFEVDGRERPLRLAGQKISFSFGPLRRISRWSRPTTIPVGLELLEIGSPKGRVKSGEKWPLEVKQLLLQQLEEVTLRKIYTYAGKTNLAGVPCARLSVAVGKTSVILSTGASIEFSGSGQVWLSLKDGSVLKATEIIEGEIVDEKLSKEPGRFAQGISIASGPQGAQLLGGQLTEKKDTGPGGTPAGAAPPAEGQATPGTSPDKVGPGAVAVSEQVPVAPRATEERIAYVSVATGMKEVWSVAPDGSRKRCITGYDNAHWNHAFDPTGRLMICASERKAATNILLMNMDDGKQRPLTTFGEAKDLGMAWSNGGEKILFLRDGRLWSVGSDGFNMQSYEVPGHVESVSGVSSSDQAVVVMDVLNQKKILVVDVVSGMVRELFPGDLACWSPDGKRIAFRVGDELHAAQADGSLRKRLLRVKLADTPLIWDPAGTKIAFTAIQQGQLDVMMIPAEGGAHSTLTSKGGEAYAFSPTGSQLAYLRYGDLWVVTVDGKVHRRVTSDGATLAPVRWGKQLVP